MENKIFMLAEGQSGEGKLQQGNIYPVPQEEKERLIAEGKAVEVNLPRLDAIELSVQRAVNEFKENEKRLLDSPRYRDMESEREYQLEQLSIKLEQDVKKLEADFQLEIQATQKELAQKAVQATFKPNETIANFVDTELVRLGFSNDVVGDLELLNIKVNALTDEEKATVLHNFGKIKSTVKEVEGDKADRLLSDIFNAVKHANGTAEFDLQLKQLRALKGYNVNTPYKNMMLVRKQTRG